MSGSLPMPMVWNPGTAPAFSVNSPSLLSSLHLRWQDMVDSDFNLPSDVTIQFDLKNPNNTNINADTIIEEGNNPHKGGLVPQAFKDANLDTKPDDEAISGSVFNFSRPCIRLNFAISARFGNWRAVKSFARRNGVGIFVDKVEFRILSSDILCTICADDPCSQVFL
jgi:hypothetical protein